VTAKPLLRRPGALALFYFALACLSGAESFTGRRESVHFAAEKHLEGWQAFLRHGFDAQGRPVEDVNVGAYGRRPLILAVVEAASAVTGLDWTVSFSFVRLLTIFVAYLVFHEYLRIWFREELALLGTLYVAAALPLAFVSNWWEIISDYPELLVFTLGMWCLHTRQYLVLTAVAFLGSLNRETTGLLLVIAGLVTLLTWRRSPPDWRASLAVFVGWGAATILLMQWLTAGSPVALPSERLFMMGINLSGVVELVASAHPYNAYLLPLPFFGLAWVLPLLAWRRLPVVLRAGVLATPLFVAIVFALGALYEPRQLMPLFPILVPASLFAVFPPSDSLTDHTSGGSLTIRG
jgi:hypothetical protein